MQHSRSGHLSRSAERDNSCESEPEMGPLPDAAVTSGAGSVQYLYWSAWHVRRFSSAPEMAKYKSSFDESACPSPQHSRTAHFVTLTDLSSTIGSQILPDSFITQRLILVPGLTISSCIDSAHAYTA